MRRLIVLSALLCLVPASAAHACASGDAATAARTLYGADLVRVERVAGLQTALALEPRIAPGTRRRMVAVRGAGWCDAVTDFNRAWASRGDGRAAAIAYASLAAAPYFDGVTVQSVRPVGAGSFELVTHAQTNGVVARWVIDADASGVHRATWTATAFAQRPFDAQWEGLTALPGATETYVDAGGLLRAVRGLPTARGMADPPAVPVDYKGADGMTISISVGDSHVAVDPGVDTGVDRADIVRLTYGAIKHNYEEYLSWGLSKGWVAPQDAALGPDRGWVYIDDALSAYCLACVFIADEFQIHFISEVETALGALGYSYPDSKKAFLDVLGHEMFHNFQNRYVKPGPIATTARKGTSTAYSEGTARFQESLHDYGDVSHQPKSLWYANDGNGCNGYNGSSENTDAAMAGGPFGHAYDACYFWAPWYVAFGKQAFLKLVRQSMPAASAESDVHREGLAALTGAASAPLAEQMATFASAALTGRGYTYSPFMGGNALDWSVGLDRWKPAVLDRGKTAVVSVANGGVMARELKTAAKVSVTGFTKAALFVVRSSSAGGVSVAKLPASGGAVKAPATGEQVWAVAVRPEAGTSSLTLRAA